MFLHLFAANIPQDLKSLLDEKQGCATLPGIVQAEPIMDFAAHNLEILLLHQSDKTGPSAGTEISMQGGVEDGEATAEEQTAVVTTAIEHGRIIKRQIPPAGVMGSFPEDGIEQGAGIGSGTAAGAEALRRRQQGFQYAPLTGGNEGKRRFREITTERSLKGG